MGKIFYIISSVYAISSCCFYSHFANLCKMNKIFKKNLLKNRVAVITGGGSGIGYSCAEQFLSLGSRVVIASRDEKKLLASIKSLKRSFGDGCNITHAQLDIRNENNVAKAVESIVNDQDKIDILVNCGGGQFPSPALNMKKKGWDSVIDTNLTGTYNMCKEVLNQSMIQENNGVIVNVTAVVTNGFAGMAHTGAARAGVINLTKSMAIECAHLGIRINCVSPGIIWSDSAAKNYNDPALLSANAPIVPFKRLGTVDEVSSMITFLSSDAASYISGQNFTVDGCLELAGSLWEVPDHSSQKPFQGDTGPIYLHGKSPLSTMAQALDRNNRETKEKK